MLLNLVLKDLKNKMTTPGKEEEDQSGKTWGTGLNVIKTCCIKLSKSEF